MTISQLELKSIQYRRRLLSLIRGARAGHTGGDLSSIDLLNVLYNHVLRIDPSHPRDPDRDRYVQSKGHCVEALYVVLADRGFFPPADLAGLNHYASPFIGHPTRKVPGIEHNTGALGHGLSVAVGMALAGQRDRRPYRVFTMLGDGELDEGSSWEASMSAAHYHLDNLVVILDRNTMQISGRTEQMLALEPLVDKFRAFGYTVVEVDGHDLAALAQTLDRMPLAVGRPSLVLMHTVKGKGISFMEGQASWHHRVPNDEEYRQALYELDCAEQQWRERYGIAEVG